MPPLLASSILASVGLVSGVVADRVRASVHGSLRRHLLLGPVFEGLAVVPGFMVAGYLLASLIPSRTLTASTPLLAAFILPYAVGRFAAGRWGRSHAARREAALPFQHWLGLLRTSPDQARDFLSAYLTQARLDGVDLIAQLKAGYASLESQRNDEPIVEGALTTLRSEISRLEQEHGYLPKRAV